MAGNTKGTHHLLKSTQIKIAKFKEKNPEYTIPEIAQQFKVSYGQVKGAIDRYNKGLLGRSTQGNYQKKKILEILKTQNDETVFKEQYNMALAQLSDEKIATSGERIKLLDQLVGIRKVLQQIELEGHIKRADAGIIKAIIRRYEPNASDDDIIKIYREELEKWKISQLHK